VAVAYLGAIRFDLASRRARFHTGASRTLKKSALSNPNFSKALHSKINADFGIFATMAAYPVYFTGDITHPKNKIIFMGINPGLGQDWYQRLRYLREPEVALGPVQPHATPPTGFHLFQ
jgi:hypothetical protein